MVKLNLLFLSSIDKNIFHFYQCFLINLGMKEMETIKEEDRLRRLQILEMKIRDPRNVSNVDSLLVRIP